jgi:phosphotransferase system enzyme I (PtsI)
VNTETENAVPMSVFRGLSINAGRVLAPTCLYSAERHRRIIETPLVSPEEIDMNLGRFGKALKDCSGELDDISDRVAESIGRAEAEIFSTQKHIMNDPAVVEAIRDLIRGSKKNVEFAVDEVFGRFEKQFAGLANDYMKERAGDIAEVRRRLLDHLHDLRPGFLCKGQQHCSRGRDRIIVAEELTPHMIGNMDLEKVLGFVTEHGGLSSHAAIMARSLGVPAVSGVRGVFNQVRCGDRMLVDGDSGVVYLNPDRETAARITRVAMVRSTDVCALESPAGTQVMANVSIIEDAEAARKVNADGIGLVRTEMLFFQENLLLNEEEQYRRYSTIVEAMQDKPVTFRLLDVGGDKPLPYVHVEEEANPYLGWRGARFLLGNPRIFSDQLRALVRASANGNVRILFPMVVDQVQVRELVGFAEEIMGEMGVGRERIQIGVMFEVPSACLAAADILHHVDFGSIGTNDLIQYLLAVDRNNDRVSSDYNPDHPVLWSVLHQLSETAQSMNRPLSLCGEMAGREGVGRRLVDLGVTSLSVAPRLIPRVRTELSLSGAGREGTAQQ